MKTVRRLIEASLLLWFAASLFAASPQDSASRTVSVAAGTWGGDQVRMEVKRHGASLAFECAAAEISEPLRLDSNGRFHARGSFRTQGPGPTRDPDQATPNADFSGTISGDRLELQVKVEGENDSHSYTLVRGRQTRLRSCK